MIIRAREHLIDGLPSITMLRSVISDHQKEIPRYRKLKDYYMAKTDILNRTRSEGLPNNRIAHPFARYIVSVTTGYLIGKPVTYSVGYENETLASILETFNRCNISAVDEENARNAAIYGKGVEYVHLDDDASIHVAALNPLNAFVVYDDTCDSKPLFGVYYVQKLKEDGALDGYQIWVMGEREIIEYHTSSLTEVPQQSGYETPDVFGVYAEVRRTANYFGGVPLIEYWNDKDEVGDIEWVGSLIDAYDKLQSDRVNDKEQFVDKLMILTGCVVDTDDKGRPPWKQLREDKALCLPDSDAHAEYISAQLDEAGTEILKDSIVNDIHKMSLVPDLTDQSFANNASGVAMRYKLWGLEQLTKTKEEWFTEALRERLKLFINLMKLRGKPELDLVAIKIKFERSMPTNEIETSQVVSTAMAAASMSTETAIRMIHAGEEWNDVDVQNELDRIKQNKDEAAQRTFDQQKELLTMQAALSAKIQSEKTADEQTNTAKSLQSVKRDTTIAKNNAAETQNGVF